ncbi:MAG: DNA methyltransferase [Pseudomonadota bacterium]|nr:DNA methyltransferase [Pseudomonadota bacterium]
MAKKLVTQTGDLYKKDIPKMPEGYYSGDKPNPNLRAFVEQHVKERPYDPKTDDYDVPAFAEPQSVVNRRDAINDLHIYWSKKPYSAITRYIRHYTESNDLVLDPFSGSGGTNLAALMEGRKTIAIDRSPAATFITKNYCTPVDVDELQKGFKELNRMVKKEIEWLYETRCDRCGGKAKTAYTVYSQVFQCPRCLEKIPLFDCVEVDGETAQGKPKKISACPHCQRRGIVEEISTRAKKFGAMPVLVNYLCESGCKPVRGERRYNDSNKKKKEYFETYDIGRLKEIERKSIQYWYPVDRMMNTPEDQERWGLLWRPYLAGVNRACDFYTKRSLWALALYLSSIKSTDKARDRLLFAFSGALWNASIMYQEREAGGGPSKGVYYVPPIYREVAVDTLIEQKVQVQLRSANLWAPSCPKLAIMVSTSNATSLNGIPDNSVDYIFTDPPYSWKVQFGESNFLWEAWLQFDTHWHDDEIIVNEVRGKSETDWANMMYRVMAECYRVLKPGRWISLCYHDTSEGTWELLQDIMAEHGYIPEKSKEALFIETGQKAWKQTVADKVNKRDLVINFRKPKPGEITATIAITGNEDKATFNEKVHQIIRDYLGAHPGSTKDRIYDEVVSRMVRSGQMEAHDFDELLRTVAEEIKTPVMKNLFEKEEPDLFGTHEVGRWYLKETELVIADAAENAREDGAAEKIGAAIREFLKKNPGDEGVHYSDLFEHYIYAVKDKPRRQLADFLPDYFYKTEQGTWRLPASEEEEKAKREARVKGLGRRVKRYIAQLDQGVIIPDNERPNDATLAEWIRHCKRSGLYEQGKLLYEKGGLNTDNLSEEAMVNVEEDYQVCVRMLTRESGKKQKKK